MLVKQDTGNIQGLELVHMRSKEMKKLLSKVQKSGVVNYARTHQSLYVSEWSWVQKAGVVLGEFQDVTHSAHIELQ